MNYRYRYRVTTDDVRPARRRPARRTARRRDPAARHARPGAPAASPPTRPSAPCRPTTSPPRPCGWIAKEAARMTHATPGPPASSTTAIVPKIVTSRFQYEDSYTLERYLATGGYDGPARPRCAHAAGEVHDEVQERHRARSRRRRLPGRHEVGADARRQVAALPRRQRRRERAGHLQGPPADGARSAPADRGLPHRLLRRRAVAVLPLHPRRDAARPRARRPPR